MEQGCEGVDELAEEGWVSICHGPLPSFGLIEKKTIIEKKDHQYFTNRRKEEKKDKETAQRRETRKENRSPKGNIWSAISVALLCMTVNLSEEN